MKEVISYGFSSSRASSSDIPPASLNEKARCTGNAYRLQDVTMLCRNPHINKNGAAYGCGQCMPCRINRRRVWTHRILLEMSTHRMSSFITLTYGDGSLPYSYNDKKTTRTTENPTLNPSDLSLWLKRYRKAITPRQIRFFACGEYGPSTYRPHYHAVIFGMDHCLNGESRYESGPDCCSVCDLVRDTWGKGFITVSPAGVERAGYVAGYVTKKISDEADPRLKGLCPEFIRVSNRPGIGVGALTGVVKTLEEYGLDETLPDVPAQLRHGAKLYPMGPYLRKQLRKMMGVIGYDGTWEYGISPKATLDEAVSRVSLLRQTAFDNSRSFKKEILAANEQNYLNLMSREKLFPKRRVL